MESKFKKEVHAVREFNRYYTNILGLLDQHILNSPYSLSEVRILHEIEKKEKCTAKMLSEILLLDAGYLSRILKSFKKYGLIEQKRSPEDGRVQYLVITPMGQAKMDELNAKSDKQIADMMRSMSDEKKEELVHCMKRIEELLEGNHGTK